jgi:uncharacterized protein
MTRADSSRTRTASLLLLLVLAFGSASALSQSFDCRAATTTVEQAICADTRLKRLDSELANNYRAAAKQVVPEGAKALLATQKAWISDRNRQCATGSNDCIAEKYRERNDVLMALLARTSDENPVIDLADPAVLLGIWTVVSDTASSSKLVPTAAHLPPPGARIIAKPGELCVVEPAEAKICSPFGLAVEPRSTHAKRPAQEIPKDSIVLLAYFGGRADFELAVGPNQELAAASRACEPAGSNCRWISQPWRAASPDAAVKIYHLFD